MRIYITLKFANGLVEKKNGQNGIIVIARKKYFINYGIILIKNLK